MSVKVEAPFKIHIATAKDLPLSWYELILRPEKFAEHLELLRHNPEALPNVSYLIVTFLEKSGVCSILCSSQSTASSFTDIMTEEKAVKLVKCALLVASTLHWDSPHIWTDLPLSVQYCLVFLLHNHFPSPEWGVVNGEGVAAHVIYSEWILKFVMSHCSSPSSLSPSRASAQTWDATCVPPEQIKDLVRSKAGGALSCLTEFLENADLSHDGGSGGDATYWEAPCVSVDLPVHGAKDHIHLHPFKEGNSEHPSILLKEYLCQVRYVVGSYHFVAGDYALAYHHLKEVQQLLVESKGHYKVNELQLKGFLLACEGMLGVGRGDKEGGEQKLYFEDALEFHLQREDYKKIAILLTQESSVTERENPTSASSSLDIEIPSTKRQKMSTSCDDSRLSSVVSLKEKVVLCSSLRRLLENRPVDPKLWKLMWWSGGGSTHIEFLIQLCDEILKVVDLDVERTRSLQSFMRSVCSRNRKTWESLLTSKTAGKQLLLSQDSAVYKHFLGDECDFLGDECEKMEVGTHLTSSSSSSVEELERKVAYITCSHRVTALVEEIFRATPTSQHRAGALKWVGSERIFAPVEGVADFVSLTKYNCLIHRGKQMEKSQFYDKGLELFAAAHEELTYGKFLKDRGLLEDLEGYVREQLLLTELMAFHQRAHGRSTIQKTEEKGLPLLMAKAKDYYINPDHWSKVESVTLVVIGAYLLNMREFSFFSLRDAQVGHNTISPRLAEAVVDVQKVRDTRKSLRALFEAVKFVFSPLLHSNEGKSEANERHSRLRANLDIFIRNLMDFSCLSLLVAVLARIWNLLKKPEDDILTDFNGNWPTAIGNAANIDSSHVFRMLNTTINHALYIYPNATSWILIKANVHTAVSEYGAALERYLETAALASDHFHKDIPEGVWSQVTLRRIISCCCKLGYYTQVVILCQFLCPVDYDLAFTILREHGSSTIDTLFTHFWDMTIIEYLIYVLSKKMDSHKQAAAVSLAFMQAQV